jgi:hypothetical protein
VPCSRSKVSTRGLLRSDPDLFPPRTSARGVRMPPLGHIDRARCYIRGR